MKTHISKMIKLYQPGHQMEIQRVLDLMRLTPISAYGEDYIRMNNHDRGSMYSLLLNATEGEDGAASFLVYGTTQGANGHLSIFPIAHAGYMKDVRCFEGGVYELFGLVVHPKYENKGYAKRLLKHIEKTLIRQKARILWAQTGSKKTVQMAKSLGYRKVGQFPDYWGPGTTRYLISKNF